MTVETVVLSNQYPGNGSTDEFDFDFPVFAASELIVRDILDSDDSATVLVLNTDYTVSGVGDLNGGTVSLTTPTASGHTLDLRPVYELEQPTRITNQGRYLPEIHERVFDRLARYIHYLRRLIGSTVRVADQEASDINDVGDVDARKGKTLTFNATTGQPEPAEIITGSPLSQSIFDSFIDDTDPQLVGELLNERTAFEISASITPSDYRFLAAESLGGMFRYGAVGNYTGPGVGTDDSTALRNAFLVIQARGGGVLDLGARRYRIFSNGSTGAIADLSNCRGVTIKSDGAELVVDRTFTGSQTVRVFQFTACSGVSFVGHLKATCTQIQAAGSKASRGPELGTFLQGCTNVTSDSVDVTGFRYVWQALKQLADADSFISRGFRMGLTKANSCGYAWTNGGNSGWQVTADLITDTCTRSYFPQGGKQHSIRLISKNHEGSRDCLITNTGTAGIDGLSLYYQNTESTTADNTLNCVGLQIQDSDVYDVIVRNVRIRLNIQNPAVGNFLGFGLIVDKITAAAAADNTDRGHTLENIEVSGIIKGLSANQRSISFCSSSTWGTGEFVDNISFRNLRIDGTGQPAFTLTALQKTATFANVYSTVQMNVTGNTTGVITMNAVECDSSITASTADTSRQIYIGCTFGSMANQSTLNKAFYSCFGLPASWTATVTGVTAVVTDTVTVEWIGDEIRHIFPGGLQGTSNTTACTLTGMPASMWPTTQQLCTLRAIDNGVGLIGLGDVSASTGVITVRLGSGSATFTNVNSKGVSAYHGFMYNRRL
jgi:hypothetical protein